MGGEVSAGINGEGGEGAGRKEGGGVSEWSVGMNEEAQKGVT